MIHGIQDTLKNATIKLYGCYFLSILEMVEREYDTNCKECSIRMPLEENDIDTLFEQSIKKNQIKDDCFIIDPIGVYNNAANYIGSSIYKKRVIYMIQQPYEYDYYIIENVKKGYTHFTLRTLSGIWDPLPPNRSGIFDYIHKSYRVLL